MSDDLYDPMPCVGGCGEMVPFPKVTCGKPECVEKHLEELARDDYWRNKVDLGDDR